MPSELPYQRREDELGSPAMRELERRVVLSVIDRRWRDHLYEMDYIKDGIGLRAMAQRDPLIEYRREGFDMFNAMLEALKEESVGFLFNVQVEAAEPQQAPEEPSVPVSVSQVGSGTPDVQPAPQPAPQPKRNRPASAGPALSQIGGAPAVGGDKVPAALRGNGLGGPAQQRLSYSGPNESGGVETSSDAAQGPQARGGTRRERRAAARAEAKKNRRR